MNKKNLIIISGIFLLVIVGLLIILSSKKTLGQSVNDLFSLNKNLECSLNETNLTGTIYLANNQARGDFKDNNTTEATIWHMIVRNNLIYGWTDGNDVGFTNSLNSNDLENNFNLNKKFDYKCKDWNSDGNKFNLPQNVNFNGSDEPLSPLTNPDPRLVPDNEACDACNTSPNKDACRQSLGCK